MTRLAAIALLVSVPWLAAAAPRLRLLDEESLSFTAEPLPALRRQVLLEDEGPPTPPGAAAARSSKRSGDENPDIPGIGSVLGYMISGGVILAYGLVFAGYGLALKLPCAISASSCAALGSLSTLGIVYSVVGGVMALVGGVLLYVGNEKRIQRNEMRSAAQMTLFYDPTTRSTGVAYATRF